MRNFLKKIFLGKNRVSKRADRRFLTVACILFVLFLAGCKDTDRALVLTAGEELAQGAEQADARRGDEAGDAQGSAVDAAEGMLYVHVCGAVKDPGVVVLPNGSRVCDALQAAGGLLEGASETSVNLAEPLKDGMQIFFPTKDEAKELERQAQIAESGLVNLNTADAALLCTLPGIGESRAADIIAYRESHGGFKSPEEIMQVPGIKEGAYAKIKDKIIVP